jgi:hypothetical protein
LVTSNTPKRLTDKAKPWVVSAIKEHSPDEQVIWDLTVVAFPDPSAGVLPSEDDADPSDSVGLQSTLLLYLEIAGPRPRTSVYASPTIAPFFLEKATISEAVKITLDSLRKKRDSLIAEEEIPEEDLT